MSAHSHTQTGDRHERPDRDKPCESVLRTGRPCAFCGCEKPRTDAMAERLAVGEAFASKS